MSLSRLFARLHGWMILFLLLLPLYSCSTNEFVAPTNKKDAMKKGAFGSEDGVGGADGAGANGNRDGNGLPNGAGSGSGKSGNANGAGGSGGSGKNGPGSDGAGGSVPSGANGGAPGTGGGGTNGGWGDSSGAGSNNGGTSGGWGDSNGGGDGNRAPGDGSGDWSTGGSGSGGTISGSGDWSATPQGMPGSFQILTLCSNLRTQRSGTNLINARAVYVRLYEMSGAEIAFTNNSLDHGVQVRNDILNTKSFNLRFPNVADGDYIMNLCDYDKSAQCVTQNPRYSDYGNPVGLLGTGTIRVKNSSLTAIQGKLEILANNNTLMSDRDTIEDCDMRRSPLMVDTAGDGFKLSSLSDGAFFDLDGNGHKELVSWPKSADDMFLVLDRNQDGAINSGREFFGNYTELKNGSLAGNGFLALRDFDANGDSRIDAQDGIYGELRLWSDGNRNGSVDADELFTLAEKSIAAVDLAYEDIFEVDTYGNETRQRSVVEVIKDNLRSFHLIIDIWFRTF